MDMTPRRIPGEPGGRPLGVGREPLHRAAVRQRPAVSAAARDPAAQQARSAALALYGLLAAFLVAVVLLGMVGMGAARVLFILGCVGVAFQAYRTGGLALHVEAVIVLFVFSSLLRRMVDVHVGYDPSGTMLIGPLLAATVVFPQLGAILSPRNKGFSAFLPYGLMLLCVVYGWSISAFQNNLLQSSIGGVKYAIPLLYCMCLMGHPDDSDPVLRSAARAFLITSPLIGLYGIWQNLSPQPWDAYWMVSSKMLSIGLPFPGKVRVFSTMNSPASFAAYATCGLLLFSFTRRSFIPPVLVPVVAILPLCLALLLSEVRTAWISAAISLIFCFMFQKTRYRAGLLVVGLGVGIAIALLFTPFADSISARMATMSGNVSDDGSGHERMGDYMHVFSEDSRYIYGLGFAPVETDTQMAAQDGQILSSAVQMGTTVGAFFILGLVWAAIQAVSRIRRDEDPLRLVAASLVVGNLVILPLTSIAVGEIGFLFWMLVGVLTSARPRRPAWSTPGPDRYPA